MDNWEIQSAKDDAYVLIDQIKGSRDCKTLETLLSYINNLEEILVKRAEKNTPEARNSMSKDIVKIKREKDGTIDIETIENMNCLELFNVTKDMVAIVTQLMLRDLDEVKYHKHKKALKEILSQAIDEGYVS